MTSTLPPDPYLALGVPTDAPAATIKATYRKLVLKCHPDKVTDESLKQQKQEEFHKIQQAYELIGDEDKRATYDAEVRLEKLRKEKLARTGPQVEVKTARYETRTAAPAGATFTSTGPHRYEERRPSKTYEDERYFDERASRKYETYEPFPRASRTSREKEPIRVTKVSSDRTRSDRNKTRDREDRRERAGKFVYIDDESSSNDEKARYEAEYRRRSEEERRRRTEDEARNEARKQAAEARRKADDRRSYEEPKEPRRHRSGDEFDRTRKLSDLENDAVRYIHRSKVEGDSRPAPSRTTSSRDVRPDPYESRSSRRPEAVRRSSARPKDRPETSGRDPLRKGIPEIVEWEDDRKAPPSFKHSSSSPAEINVPRATPQRSYTESSRDRRTETSPTPMFRRSETMPSVPHSSSSRRKEPTPSRPSGLRSAESASPREPETTGAFPSVPPPRASSGTTSKYYHYPTPGGGVSLRPEDVGVANGHRTILREPDRRTRSPSPLSRPPMGPNRHVETGSSRTTSAAMPPPLGRSATFNHVSPSRGQEEQRGRRLYGELPSDFTKRENARRQTSFSPDSVQYAPKIGPDDIRWSRGRDPLREEREYATKPTLGRHATWVH